MYVHTCVDSSDSLLYIFIAICNAAFTIHSDIVAFECGLANASFYMLVSCIGNARTFNYGTMVQVPGGHFLLTMCSSECYLSFVSPWYIDHLN